METINPLVTIIVVSYNQGKYIRENLDSIKSQTYSEIELIVADDASTDDSIEVFESWIQENNYSVKKNFHTKNTGLATVLNECIDLATAKYIKIIAADDFLHPKSIEKCVRKLEELGEEFGMVFSDTFAINENSKIIADITDYNKFGNVSPELFRKELVRGNRIAALTVLMRLDVVKETGSYDSKFIVEDYYRWLKINQKYLIAYIPEKLAYYRQHENNISKLKAEKINQEDLMLRLMFDEEGNMKDEINMKIFSKYINNIKLDKDLIELYKNYPNNIKRLKLALKYNIPTFLYKFVSKIM
ncbi:glycosyltransferase family 2 protein [Soonwooa purpurea]